MSRKHLFQLTQIIRNFFGEQGFLDVMTPPAVENPGMEVHIHPFQLYSVYKKEQRPLFLHTSPEFCMKELLASEEDFNKIFTLTYAFRDEPESPIHRPQFVMLEWYRKHERYEKIMQDVEQLIKYLLDQGPKKGLPLRESISNYPFIKMTVQELFQNELGIDILKYLDVPSIKKLLKSYPDVPVPESELEWEDYFFLLYLNKIETVIPKKYPLLLIYEFPAPLSALSTLKKSDPRVCERFEVYINGIEICNAFNELTDSIEQKKRFTEQGILKKKLYHYELPEPKAFYKIMDSGLPPSAGIALGVERILYSIFRIENPFYIPHP
jgi:lysyl-tRNA synthetase class 2